MLRTELTSGRKQRPEHKIMTVLIRRHERVLTCGALQGGMGILDRPTGHIVQEKKPRVTGPGYGCEAHPEEEDKGINLAATCARTEGRQRVKDAKRHPSVPSAGTTSGSHLAQGYWTETSAGNGREKRQGATAFDEEPSRREMAILPCFWFYGSTEPDANVLVVVDTRC